MSKFWSPFVKELVPYVPGEQPKIANLVKLNTNENPYGPSPKAIAAMQAELGDSLRLYPDPNSDRLKQAVAEHYGVTTAQVFVGNGSDEVLAHIFHGLFQHGRPLLFPDVTYSFYPVYCGLYGIPFEALPLDEQFQIRVEDYARPNAGIIFPNPNAPPAACWRWRPWRSCCRAARIRWWWSTRPTSTSVARAPSPWWIATRTCWSPRPCPSPVPWLACAWAWRWGTRT